MSDPSPSGRGDAHPLDGAIRVPRKAPLGRAVVRVVRCPGPSAEASALEVRKRLPDFGFGVHHERPVLDDGLIDRAALLGAHVLHELGKIMTPNQLPTMTEDMARRTGAGLESDPNKRFQLDWDPNHVWLLGYTDTDGVFKLEGGAQAESDVTQLAKRLAASVYFLDVSPAGGERVADATSGLNYYKFTITGKVAY